MVLDLWFLKWKPISGRQSMRLNNTRGDARRNRVTSELLQTVPRYRTLTSEAHKVGPSPAPHPAVPDLAWGGPRFDPWHDTRYDTISTTDKSTDTKKPRLFRVFYKDLAAA